MANFKLTISDNKGKSVTKELKDNDVNQLLGLQIGNDTDASIVGLEGKMKVTGGSDKSGIPMRPDLHGMARKQILIPKGVGLQDTVKGLRKRKLVRGNTISEEIYQINFRYDGEMKVESPKEEVTEAPKEEPKKEASKKEAPKEAPKEASKKEAPKEEPKKEAPKEEPKKEAPKEAPKKEPKEKKA